MALWSQLQVIRRIVSGTRSSCEKIRLLLYLKGLKEDGDWEAKLSRKRPHWFARSGFGNRSFAFSRRYRIQHYSRTWKSESARDSGTSRPVWAFPNSWRT